MIVIIAITDCNYSAKH